MEDNNITLITTGSNWLGHGALTSYDTILDLIQNAKREIVLTAFSFTNKEIISAIEKALCRGINVTIYLNKSLCENNEALNKFQVFKEENLPVSIIEINDAILHAKVIVSDRVNVYCGSANLSYHGMAVNYELGLLLENNPKIATDILEVLRKLR